MKILAVDVVGYKIKVYYNKTYQIKHSINYNYQA